MIRSLTFLLLAVALGACGRDLDLPPASTLVLANAFPSVAPRETLALVATGGAPPYAFSFEGGSAGSGPDATLDPATGAYTAGSVGPAIDVVIVRDASGREREARIQVGPPLQATGTTAFVAPGGRASFGPTGGKPPYTVQIVSGPGSVDGVDFVAPASGGCSGTVSPPATATLTLRDATAAAPIDLSVVIGRGLDLFPAVGAGEVAPYEQIAFVASGGQPPYEFGMADDPIPSSGPGIDPGRGTYVAGPVGNVVDRVRVTDANGEQRCFDVGVGPSLTVTLSTEDIRPGKSMRIIASGGRAPYSFSFAPKGNRSRGRLEPVTGEYVPGLNALATDLVVVGDATDAPPLGPIALRLGPLRVDSGPASMGCAAGDVDGDGREEAISFVGSATVVSQPPGSAPTAERYAIGATAEPVVIDLDLDGDADLAWVEDGELRTLLGQASGGLTEGPRTWLAASTPLAAAKGTARLFMTSPLGPGACAGFQSVVGLDLDPYTHQVVGIHCVAPEVRAEAMAAGDLDGDGLPDVGYATRYVTDRISVRLAASGYATAIDLPLPPPWRVERLPSTIIHDMIEVRPAAAPASDVVAIVIDAPVTEPYRTGLAVVTGSGAGPLLGPVEPLQPGETFNLLGVSAVGTGPTGRPRLATWNGTDGTALLLDYPFTASPPPPSAVQLAPRPFRVGCIAGADLDGDRVEDLFVGPRDAGPSADLLGGEGDGGWALRPRFSGAATLTGAGDVDGDGRTELVGKSPDQGIEVLFLTDGQIAVGPETPIDGQFLGARAADWDGDGVADLVARIGASGLWLLRGLPSADGRFAAPEEISVVDVSGAPFDVTTVLFTSIELGGPATGPDLLAIIRIGSQLHHAAIVFSDATHAVIGLSSPAGGVDLVAADLDGDGVQDVVTGAGSAVRAALVKPGDPAGPQWPFRPWIDLALPDWPTMVGAVAVPGASPARERAVAVLSDRFVLVEEAAGVLQASPVALDASLALDYAVLGDATGDGLPDLLVAQVDPEPWHVFEGTAAGTFAASPRADLAFDPFPTSVSFALLPGDSGADDLLLDLGGTYVVLRNDGTGRFH